VAGDSPEWRSLACAPARRVIHGGVSKRLDDNPQPTFRVVLSNVVIGAEDLFAGRIDGKNFDGGVLDSEPVNDFCSLFLGSRMADDKEVEILIRAQGNFWLPRCR
jgi:hypothetical protein